MYSIIRGQHNFREDTIDGIEEINEGLRIVDCPFISFESLIRCKGMYISNSTVVFKKLQKCLGIDIVKAHVEANELLSCKNITADWSSKLIVNGLKECFDVVLNDNSIIIAHSLESCTGILDKGDRGRLYSQTLKR